MFRNHSTHTQLVPVVVEYHQYVWLWCCYILQSTIVVVNQSTWVKAYLTSFYLRRCQLLIKSIKIKEQWLFFGRYISTLIRHRTFVLQEGPMFHIVIFWSNFAFFLVPNYCYLPLWIDKAAVNAANPTRISIITISDIFVHLYKTHILTSNV